MPFAGPDDDWLQKAKKVNWLIITISQHSVPKITLKSRQVIIDVHKTQQTLTATY